MNSSQWAYFISILLLIYFSDPGTQFPGNEKITLCNTEKYKNQPGMNLTHPPPSQNSHAVRWHCTFSRLLYKTVNTTTFCRAYCIAYSVTGGSLLQDADTPWCMPTDTNRMTERPYNFLPLFSHYSSTNQYHSIPEVQ